MFYFGRAWIRRSNFISFYGAGESFQQKGCLCRQDCIRIFFCKGWFWKLIKKILRRCVWFKCFPNFPLFIGVVLFHEDTGLRDIVTIFVIPYIQLLEITIDLIGFFEADDFEWRQKEQISVELSLIKRLYFLVSDFSIPFLKLVYKVDKHLIGLHVRMMIEFIEIHLRQIGTGKKLGNLLFVEVTLVIAHEFMNGCVFTFGLWFLLCFHYSCFGIRN